MNTTSLFVELIVIGIGALLWFTMLLLLFFDIDSQVVLAPLKEGIGDIGLLIIAVFTLPIMYVLGILSDRIADKLFDAIWGDSYWKTELGNKHPGNRDEFLKKRMRIYECEYLRLRFDYGRSRLRICRGWSLNTALITIIGYILLLNYTVIQWYSREALVLLVVGTVLTLAIGWVWHALTKTELSKVTEEYNLLQSKDSLGKITDQAQL